MKWKSKAYRDPMVMEMDDDSNMDRNSMSYWFPLVEKLVPCPKTRIFPLFQKRDVFNLLDDEALITKYANALRNLIEKDFEYPVFFRTSNSAEKHAWNRTCFVKSPHDVANHVAYIVDSALSKDIFFDAFVIREFLQLESAFTCFNGMPVAKEFRYFSSDGMYICHHPYWGLSAILNPSTSTWREATIALRSIDPSELQMLTDHANRVTSVIKGYWSLDFCKTKGGAWFLTDMALANDSYHWSTCPNAPVEMLERYGDPDVPKPRKTLSALFEGI